MRMLMEGVGGLALQGVQIDKAEDGTFDVPDNLVPLAKRYGAIEAQELEPRRSFQSRNKREKQS